MPMPIIADVAVGPAFVLVGLLFGARLFIPVVAAEALVLRLLKWGSFWRCLRDSLIVNFATTLVGLVLAVVFLSVEWYTWPPFILGVMGWALSILIEACLLGWLEHYEVRRTDIAAVAINTVSYLLLAGFVVFLFPSQWIFAGR